MFLGALTTENRSLRSLDYRFSYNFDLNYEHERDS